VREADVEEGCRAIGFTLGTPGPSQLGVVDGILVDRAFVADRQKQAQELAETSDVNPPAPHNIANALAAAALARAFGVPPKAVRDGLRAFRLDRVDRVTATAETAPRRTVHRCGSGTGGVVELSDPAGMVFRCGSRASSRPDHIHRYGASQASSAARGSGQSSYQRRCASANPGDICQTSFIASFPKIRRRLCSGKPGNGGRSSMEGGAR